MKPHEAVAVIWLVLMLGNAVAQAVEPVKTLLHIEKTDTRATISCIDHKPPTVRSLKNEPVVVVDCERTK